MPRTKLINGVRFNFTAEEEARRDEEEAQVLTKKQNREQEKTDAEAKRFRIG